MEALGLWCPFRPQHGETVGWPEGGSLRLKLSEVGPAETEFRYKILETIASAQEGSSSELQNSFGFGPASPQSQIFLLVRRGCRDSKSSIRRVNLFSHNFFEPHLIRVPQCRRIMFARRRCAPCSAHLAYPTYLARLAIVWWWWWWIYLFIQPYTDPEWILTAAGLIYIYDRNPIPGPPSPPPFPRSYLPPPPPLPMAVGDCYRLPNLHVAKEKQH